MLYRISFCTILFLIIFFLSCDVKIQNTQKEQIGASPKLLTQYFRNNSDPAWSPDGTMIAYSHLSTASNLWSISLAGEQLDRIGRVNEDLRNDKFDLSPDGTKVAYFSKTKRALMIHDLQTGTESVLESKQYNYADPAFSPDGAWIAYSAKKQDFGRTSIWKTPASGGTSIQITDESSSDFHPSWSPDGSKIAFDSYRSYNSTINVMDVETRDSYQLTSDSYSNRYPDWSPDGETIVYYSTRNDTTAIYTIPAEGGRETKLTKNLLFAQNPAWSPDGSKIACRTNRGIWVLSTDGEIIHKTPLNVQHPVWLPSGNTLIQPDLVEFSNINIFTLSDSLNSPTTKSIDFQYDSHPSWFPDSKQIAFIRKSPESFYAAIWTIPIRRGKAEPLIIDEIPYYNEQNIALSPDGNWLIFQNADRLFSYSMTEKKLVDTLQSKDSAVAAPAWASDSKSIICRADYGGISNSLKIYTFDSGKFNEARTISGNYFNPAWSVSHPVFGAHISAEKFGDIYIMRPDGTESKEVITRGSQPCWSPDGTHLAYIYYGQLYKFKVFLDLPTF